MGAFKVDFTKGVDPIFPEGTEARFSRGGSYANGRLEILPPKHNDYNAGRLQFVSDGGTLSITIGVSSEPNYDWLSVNCTTNHSNLGYPYPPLPDMKGGNVANISGSVQKETYTYSIPAGITDVVWCMRRDGSGGSGLNTGFVYDVTIPLKGVSSGDIWTNVNGVWKQGETMTNVGGVWKQGQTWTNVNGIWKTGV